MRIGGRAAREANRLYGALVWNVPLTERSAAGTTAPVSEAQRLWVQNATQTIWRLLPYMDGDGDSDSEEVAMVAKRWLLKKGKPRSRLGGPRHWDKTPAHCRSTSTVHLVPGPGRALLSRRPLAKGAALWREKPGDDMVEVEVEDEECTAKAEETDVELDLSPYQVWQLLRGFTEESTLTVTAGSNEGVLPSFVYNNILETLMDQEDEDLEAFETDLGQVLRDLTVALRDIVENVKENKARKKRPSPKPKPAPNTTLQSSCNHGTAE